MPIYDTETFPHIISQQETERYCHLCLHWKLTLSICPQYLISCNPKAISNKYENTTANNKMLTINSVNF